MLGRIFSCVMVLGLSVPAFAGFASTYSGRADCGAAQDWPRENVTEIWNQQCNVSLTLSPDGLDQWGRLAGDVQFIVSDMSFRGSYIEQNGRIYLDFDQKSYQNYRGATRLKRFNGSSYIVATIGRDRVVFNQAR